MFVSILVLRIAGLTPAPESFALEVEEKGTADYIQLCYLHSNTKNSF